MINLDGVQLLLSQKPVKQVCVTMMNGSKLQFTAGGTAKIERDDIIVALGGGVETSGTADHVLPFPLQNTLTRPLRTAAAKQARPEYLSLWAGQGLRLARRQSASELIARLARETMETFERLSRTGV